MSGGRFNYTNDSVRYEMEGEWLDAEINEMFYDLFCAPLWGNRDGGLATALDFFLSGDVCEETYREYAEKFKDKWLGRTPDERARFYADKLQERCDELKTEMLRGMDCKIGGSE